VDQDDRVGSRMDGPGLPRGRAGATLIPHELRLRAAQLPNQDSPLMDGKRVLFGNDVWEHAYYLNYQNRRADYLRAWWNVANWTEIGNRYAAARAGTLAF
jgi:superoxide dismutase, Fe-Mn family